MAPLMRLQLKKLGGMEFYDVNFSYIDNETFEEHYVSVPEQGGGKLIPLPQLPQELRQIVGDKAVVIGEMLRAELGDLPAGDIAGRVQAGVSNAARQRKI